MYHKTLALIQVFVPIDVLMPDPAFMRVEHALGGSNYFSKADRCTSYEGNVLIEAARMIYKTRHNSLQPNAGVQMSSFQGPKP
jgi:hypothetical protein